MRFHPFEKMLEEVEEEKFFNFTFIKSSAEYSNDKYALAVYDNVDYVILFNRKTNTFTKIEHPKEQMLHCY